MADRLKPHLNPGVDISRLDPKFVEALVAMFGAAPPELSGKLRIGSGYRDVPTQTRLFNEAVTKYGSPEAARKWVAPPGQSRHNHGSAVDLAFGDDTVKQWVHANAANHGLHFPMSWEPWHIEPAGAPPAAPPAATPGQPGVPNLTQLMAAFAPAPGVPQQRGFVEPSADALTSAFDDYKAKREREEAETQARRRVLFSV